MLSNGQFSIFSLDRRWGMSLNACYSSNLIKAISSLGKKTRFHTYPEILTYIQNLLSWFFDKHSAGNVAICWQVWNLTVNQPLSFNYIGWIPLCTVLFCPCEVLFIFALRLIALAQHLSAVSSTLEIYAYKYCTL